MPSDRDFYAGFKQVLPTPREPTYRFRIVGDHPHRGETGTADPEDVIRVGAGEPMVRINLDDGDACYAGMANLRHLRADEDPMPCDAADAEGGG